MVDGKYRPLAVYLKSLGAAEWRATFADVERVLGAGLPASAHKYPAWWSNNVNDGRHCMAWLDVGWKTEELDLSRQRVIFRRASRPWTRPPTPNTAPFESTSSIMC